MGKRGRPKTFGPKTHLMHFVLHEDDFNAVVALARADDRSISYQLRKLVREALQARKQAEWEDNAIPLTRENV
jgi:hypothetical protein